MATKCTRHHPSWSFYGLALSRRAFSLTLETRSAIKRLTNANGYLVSLPFLPSPSDFRRRLSPSLPLTAIWLFFAAFHGAQVATPLRPSSPARVEAKGVRQGESRAGGERAVTFVTFSLLRFSSWFAFQSRSYSPPLWCPRFFLLLPASLFATLEPSLVNAALYVFPASWIIALAAQQFQPCVFHARSFSQNHSNEAHKGFHFLK